jgi:uncharacterized protein YjdB
VVYIINDWRKTMKKKLVTFALIIAMLIPMLLITPVAEASGGPWLWPVDGFRTISSVFGPRGSGHHNGIDIAGSGINGRPFRAARGGTAHAFFNHSSLGNYIIINHWDGYFSLYAHASSLNFTGQRNVVQGEVIGRVGSTGNSTGPHLHFEIRHKSNYNSSRDTVRNFWSYTPINTNLSSMTYIYRLGDTPSPNRPVQTTAPIITYRGHVQNHGWHELVSDGQTAGTTGQGLRLESLNLLLAISGAPNAQIRARANIAGEGWQNHTQGSSVTIGTTGRSRAIEAVTLELINAPGWGIEYRVHSQIVGWGAWVRDGAIAGTTGRSLRAEAIEVRLISPISYRGHVQSHGWFDFVSSGQTAGSTGYGMRLESLNLSLAIPGVPNAQIRARAHVATEGWHNHVQGTNVTIGTTGRARAIEALTLELVNAPGWSIEYRVHSQSVGWGAWVRDGGTAGTTGRSLRAEAVEVRLIRR